MEIDAPFFDGDFEGFRADRLRALTSMDVQVFRDYMAKHNPDMIGMVSRMDDEQVLRSLHLARLGANFIDAEGKAVSAHWLRSHGYRGWEGILDGDAK